MDMTMATPYMISDWAMPLIPNMTTITIGTNMGNTSLAVPHTHFHRQRVCPKAEDEQLAPGGPT